MALKGPCCCPQRVGRDEKMTICAIDKSTGKKVWWRDRASAFAGGGTTGSIDSRTIHVDANYVYEGGIHARHVVGGVTTDAEIIAVYDRLTGARVAKISLSGVVYDTGSPQENATVFIDSTPGGRVVVGTGKYWISQIDFRSRVDKFRWCDGRVETTVIDATHGSANTFLVKSTKGAFASSETEITAITSQGTNPGDGFLSVFRESGSHTHTEGGYVIDRQDTFNTHTLSEIQVNEGDVFAFNAQPISAMTVSPNGSYRLVYANFADDFGTDYRLFDDSGVEMWEQFSGLNPFGSNYTAPPAAVDNSGNTYSHVIVGTRTPHNPGDTYDNGITCIDSSGSEVWRRSLPAQASNGPFGGAVTAYADMVHDGTALYVVSNLGGSGLSGARKNIVRLNTSDGTIDWEEAWTTDTGNVDAHPWSVAVDDDYLYVCGFRATPSL